jgi:DNA-directed RNA polymerase specialized sigma24 family protein
MSVATFFAMYDRQLHGMARALMRRWQVPSAVTEEDVFQELCLGAWRAWQTWQAGRGSMTREAYAICSARLHAQRWMHEQRGALRRSGKAPSRFPTSESAVDSVAEPWVESGQMEAVAFLERLRLALEACATKREQLALSALINELFDTDAAVRRLYDDDCVRQECQFGSRQQARAVVRRIMCSVEASV